MRHARLLGLASVPMLVVIGATPAPAATPDSTPGVVRHVTASTRSSSTIALSWTNPTSASFTATVVRVARGSAAPTSPTAGTRVASVSRRQHSVTATKLSPGVGYSFALFATDGHGHFAHGVTVRATTAPAPVTGVQTFDTGSNVSIEWTNPKTPSFSGTVVRYAKGTHAPSSPTAGTAVSLAAPKASVAQLAGLALDTAYSVAVWTHDSANRYSTAATTRFTSAAAPAAAGSVSGTVTDTAGNPLRGVVAGVFDYQTGTARSASTDATGEYALPLPAGTYYISFTGGHASGGNSDSTGYLGGYQEAVVTEGHPTSGVDTVLHPGGAITGRIRDDSGRPLAGVVASVSLARPYVTGGASGLFALYDFGTEPGAPSNRDGSFVLKGLPPEAFLVCFDTSVPGIAGGAADPTGYTGRCRSSTVAVARHATRRVADTVLTPAPGGAITGRVTSSDGTPAANVQVQIQSQTEPGFSDFQGYIYTADDGRYALPGLAPGGYQVCVDPRSTLSGVSALGDAPRCRAGAVTVVADQVSAADVALIPGGAITGKVTVLGTTALPGVGINALSVDGTQLGTAVTDSTGHYVINGLGTDAFTLCFDPQSATAPGDPTGAAPSCRATRFNARAGATRIGLDADLAVGAAISGTVTDAAGHPSALVDVQVQPADGAQGDGGFGATDGQGKYTVVGLTPGAYTVCFLDFSTGFSVSANCYRDPRTPHANGIVEARAGTMVPHIDGVVTPDSASTVTVTVNDRRGHPVAGVDAALLTTCTPDADPSVSSCSTDSVMAAGKTVNVMDSQITFDDGTATFYGVGPGHYAVCLHAYYGTTLLDPTETGYADKCTGSTFDVVVAKGQSVSLAETLQPAGAVTGKITDLAGHPLAGVLVHVSNSAGDDFGSTDQFIDPLQFGGPALDSVTAVDGSYAIRSVAPGQQTICVDARAASGGDETVGYTDQCLGGEPGSTSGGTPVTVTANSTTTVAALALTRAAAISGRVTDRSGHGLKGVDVGVLQPDGTFVADVFTSSTGAYTAGHLGAGPKIVCFYAEPVGYASQCYRGVAWNPRDGRLPAHLTQVPTVLGVTRTGIDASLVRP
ncbi:MAG: hypothetical protein QOH52_2826 [Pseudonocardiales bacterium]|nr:hypothetical protein [Pseudonocardiales bacterium]